MENKNPIISIITPYYNSQDYIEETAKSVLNQTFENFEWIIVDDGSSNESKKKLKQISKLDDRIRIITGKTNNGGPATARDLGIKNSNYFSKYIVFLDSDDLYDKTFLECCYWTMETHPKASWCYTDSINFGARNFLWRKYYNVNWELEENILLVSSCVRKEDLIEVGCFGTKEKGVYEDWYLWIKLIKAGKYPIRINALLTYYRQKTGESELKKANLQNRKKAMRLIKNAERDLMIYRDGIQYPKFDYYFEKIEDWIINPEAKKKDNKIHVLMILPWMITGGADRFNLELVKNIDKEKFDFTVVTVLPATNEWREKFENFATVYDLTTFLDMKDWTSFINYAIKKNNINLIFNSNNQFGYKILPYLKAKYPKIPIVDFVHMEEWYWRNGGFSRDSSILQNIIDKTFTCNENSRRVFINKFKRDEREIKTIYIGVDEKKYDPDKFNKDSIIKEFCKENSKFKECYENGKKIISYICRITEQKRPFLFIQIIKKLLEQRNDFIVLVAGEGDLLDSVKRKVIEYKMNEFFVFLGNITEPQKIYKISDLTVNTSIKEGLALTSYESLAMNVPVVSSDVGGQAELINQDVGVIVPCLQKEEDISKYDYSKEEVKNYVDAINEVFNNLDFYKQNCRNRILKNFTIDNMVNVMQKKLIEIYEHPDKEKEENGVFLAKNMDILKELISTYFASSKREYEYLVDEFNKRNVHINKMAKKKTKFYEHTLEYKIKHPIVVFLKKIGIYEKVKELIFNN